ncbi:TPA: hypothetical protein MC761_004777 [Enterobacter cloacae]|nr:hypothetical protein [Enterobacter cloacae]
MDAEMLLWAYRTGDFQAISAEFSEFLFAMETLPEANADVRLKLSLITHLQFIGMTYNKPELQQLSIVILCTKQCWQVKAAIKEAILLMEDIIS